MKPLTHMKTLTFARLVLLGALMRRILAASGVLCLRR
jgi:hypothetical protein